jgi:flagellar basal-body rod protein FlgC
MIAQTTKIGSVAGNAAKSGTVEARSAADAALTKPDVDLGGEMATLVEAAQSCRANATVFDSGADLWDLLMSIKRD